MANFVLIGQRCKGVTLRFRIFYCFRPLQCFQIIQKIKYKIICKHFILFHLTLILSDKPNHSYPLWMNRAEHDL